MRILLLGIILTAGFQLSAEIKISDTGAFAIGKANLRLICFDKNWRAAAPGSKNLIVKERKGNRFVYDLNLPELKGTVLQTITSRGNNSWHYRVEVQLSPGSSAAQLALDMTASTTAYEGVTAVFSNGKFSFPQNVLKIKDPFNLLSRQVNFVELPLKRSRVTFRSQTPFIFMVQDDRAAHGNTFTVRLLLNKETQNRYTLSLNITEKPYRFVYADLRQACNSSFVDDVAGDRKGGWFDQGQQDLRRLTAQTKSPDFGDVPFILAAPANNSSNSCIVLKGAARSYFPEKAEVRYKTPIRGNYLYCLHTLGWGTGSKIGTIILEFTDKTIQKINVKGGTDVGDWFNPQGLSNGAIAWSVQTGDDTIGLYRSVFRTANKPIRKISFVSAGKSVWAILAVTMSSDRVPEQKVGGPLLIRESADWQPIHFARDIQVGSILDFSGYLDAPAGKYGPVVVRNGRYEFRDRPGKPVRFYGTNLVDTAQYLSKTEAEQLAERIARAGFNLIRIHHQDNELSIRKNGNSTELDPVDLDKLNYLIACFKKRGIYIITDCYVSRTFTKAEEAAWGAEFFAFKELVWLNKSAMENWKRFSRNWFTAPNPYTGVPLAQENALIGVNLINEGYFGESWNGKLGKIKEQIFQKYRAENNKKDTLAVRAEWLLKVYDDGFNEMKRFLREELKMTVPISDQNHNAAWLQIFPRDKYDYIDNHFYFDHPAFPVNPWQLPIAMRNESSLRSSGGDLTWMFSTRIWGKPVAITEYDYPNPNPYRAEGGVLPAAYAGLQDWNAMVQFAYSHGKRHVSSKQLVGGSFDLVSDVVKTLSHRIGVKLFLGNEIKPAPVKLAVALSSPEEMTFEMHPSKAIRNLGLVAQLGTTVIPDKQALSKLPVKVSALVNMGCNFPAEIGNIPAVFAGKANSDPIGELIAKGLLPRNSRNVSKQIYRSAGGQLEMNTRDETFRASAPGIEVAILPPGKSMKTGIMKVTNKTGRGIFSLQATDGKTLKDSKRLLFLHLTDSQASLLKFDDARKRRFSSWGKAPHLAAKGEAVIELKLNGNYTVFSCDTAGKRLAQIPVTKQNDTIIFSPRVFSQQGAVFVYELVSE